MWLSKEQGVTAAHLNLLWTCQTLVACSEVISSVGVLGLSNKCVLVQETAGSAVHALVRGAPEEGERCVRRLRRRAAVFQVLRPGLVSRRVHSGPSAY